MTELFMDKMELGGVIVSAIFLAGAAFRAGWLAVDNVARDFGIGAEAPVPEVSRRPEIALTGRPRELSA